MTTILHKQRTTLKQLLTLGIACLSGQAWPVEAGFDSLLSEAQTHLRSGRYFLAQDDLKSAQKLAVTAEQTAEANGALGQTYYQMRRFEEAETLLRLAINANVGEDAERSRWLLTLADLQANRKQYQNAGRLYKQALQMAGQNQELAAAIHLGQAALMPDASKLAELWSIRELLNGIADPAVRARDFLNLGAQAQGLGTAGMKLAYESFEQARQNAGEQQTRILAESLDGLAQLYEDQNRPLEAMSLNDQGIQAAQKNEAHDLLIKLEWRQGRLHRRQQQTQEALLAYQRAVGHIEAIRHDIPVEYHNGRSSFRELLEPVYLGLADLLLIQASQQSGEFKKTLLQRARETVESIKQSELEDFLGGRCSVQCDKNVLLDTVEPQTAILYPILLPDRLELLVSSGSEMRQFTQAVPAAMVQKQTQQFALSLRNGADDAKNLARQLHQWLIAPIEPWLHEQRVQTLVMVPDGVLRLIPPAALYDGQHYLIEQYALAVSPGLSLLQPTSMQQHGVSALLAGLSEPGPVVEHLSAAFMKDLQEVGSRGAASVPHSRALPANLHLRREISQQGGEADAARLASDSAFRQQLKEELRLPGVAKEIETLRGEMSNQTLMNEDFTVERFERQVEQEPYTVVHIASHGVFGGSADTSFLMAYDNIIDMDELERLLKSEKFAKQPLELLTLSACQTAEGDDRAPLGLSGIAIKAKVRSALGSLWPVSDDAASLLMAEFYKGLSQPGMSKVQALRQAQITLIRNKDLENPFFWSSFILVGNWL